MKSRNSTNVYSFPRCAIASIFIIYPLSPLITILKLAIDITMFGFLVWVWVVLVLMCIRKTQIFKLFVRISNVKYKRDISNLHPPSPLYVIGLYISKLIIIIQRSG